MILRKLAVIAAAVVAIALSLKVSADGPGTKPAEGAAPAGRLVVLIIIDQFRYDYLTRFQSALSPEGGFASFRRGAFFTEARYGHATTYTGPGHAHIATGGYACETGMVGNKWYDRAQKSSVAITGDPDAHCVGGAGDEKEGTSPRNLIGSTVGDELVLSVGGGARDPRSGGKVVAVSLKPRSAILPAGKLGAAYWFDARSGGFISSSYYMKALPAWAAAWNAQKVADGYFGKEWTGAANPLLAGPDDAPFEGDLFGLGRVFPHKVNGKIEKPGLEFYEALEKTPFASELELGFARAAIEGESLGRHAQPDMLVVSLSANDEVGHTYGPMSREVLEMTVATDRLIGGFLDALHGLPRVVAILTADHGAAPIPEQMAALGVDAHRIKKKEIKAAVETALSEQFGKGDWVEALEDPSVYLNGKTIEAHHMQFPPGLTLEGEHELVENAAARALEKVPGIARAFTRTSLMKGEVPNTDVGRSVERCFYPERSGDVLVLTKPYSFWGKYAEKVYGDSHGTPYEYDAHVPLAFFGDGVRPGLHEEPVSMARLAPTLAEILGVGAPPCAHEPALEGVLPR